MTIHRTWPLEPPSIEHGWRMPISASARKSSDRLHYMPVLSATNELLPALCGRLFNPGFAKDGQVLGKCFRCERRLSWA